MLLGAAVWLSGCSNAAPVAPVATVQEGRVFQALEQTGEWFLNNRRGEFIAYEYLPFERVTKDTRHPLREMAALWAIARLGHFLKDERYDDLARIGMKSFERYFKKDPEGDFYIVNVDPGKTKLAYSAFAILALLEMPEYLQRDYYLEKFANGLLAQQKENGELETFFDSDQNSGADYYPGEALLALMSLYEEKPDPRYVEAAQKALSFYRKYWRENRNTAFVPWHTQADVKLYRATDDSATRDEAATFVFEMNDWMLDQHHPTGDCEGFDFSRGIVTAVYLEGVVRAYELARDTEDNARAACYAAFVREGVDAVLALQFTEENHFGKPNYEPAALGGFLGTPTDDLMRVDRNQHAAFALMGALQTDLVE